MVPSAKRTSTIYIVSDKFNIFAYLLLFNVIYYLLVVILNRMHRLRGLAQYTQSFPSNVS